MIQCIGVSLLDKEQGGDLDLKGNFISGPRRFLALGTERELILQIIWVSAMREGGQRVQRSSPLLPSEESDPPRTHPSA